MLQELKQAKEIAIDLEHHDQRSFIGLVSLMQISTRDQDWIVDTLTPWRRKLQCLNEVFADPGIVKVLHGAFMDAVWLQRDLGLYLVGLFDTHHAARSLGYPGGSLAYLLKRFADVDAQKQYQTADWRIRPLPKELFDYARSDTHYLLYIFDCMRNELIQRSNLMLPDREGDKLWDVLVKSNEVALQRYEHPIYDYELGSGGMGWYKMVKRTPALLTREQFAVFRAVHQWRDSVAREQDDSNNWVMPNHQVITIAKEMPTNRAALLGIAQPTTQTLRLRADELVPLIVQAKDDGKDGPEMFDVMALVEPQPTKSAPAKAAPSHSVAAFMPQPQTGADASVLPLRSATSSFWGRAFNSSEHSQQRHPMSTSAEVNLSVPLPPLTAEVFADPPPMQTPIEPEPAEEYAEPEPTPAPQPDSDVFVLKELNRKRKRREQTDGMAAQSDEVALHGDGVEDFDQKAERKAAKKAAKRAAKLAAGGAMDVDAAYENGVDADEPFDYAAAPSVLNPQREGRAAMKERKKKEKDPYAKSLDAPKGLPRAQRERAGKSMTFKK